MLIGILTTRKGNYHPNRRLLEEAREMGHFAILIHPILCSIGVGGSGKEILYSGGQFPRIDCLLPRIGATIDEYELAVVRHLESMGIPVANGYGSLLISRDKFLTLHLLDGIGIRVPRSILVAEGQDIMSLVSRIGEFPVVLKLRRGRQGMGVMLAESPQALDFVLKNREDGEGIVIQEFVREAYGRDIRILVIGGRVVASMMRVSRKGEFRANVHLRAKGHPYEPSKEMKETAVASAKALGLEVAGVDIIMSRDGPCVIEVNSTPGFRELERVTGMNVAREIILHARSLIERR